MPTKSTPPNQIGRNTRHERIPRSRTSIAAGPALRKVLSVAAVIATSIIFTGCERKPQELYVQVFVATRSGSNVRLSLVQVNAIPLEEAKNALSTLVLSQKKGVQTLDVEITEELSRLQNVAQRNKEEMVGANQISALNVRALNGAIGNLRTAVKNVSTALRTEITNEGSHIEFATPESGRYEKRYKQSEAEISELDYAAQLTGLNASNAGLYVGVGDRVRTAIKKDFWNAVQHQRDSVLKAATEFESAARALDVTNSQIARLKVAPPQQALEHLQSQRASLLDPTSLYKALPSPAQTVKTDAEGKCRLLLDSSRRWFITASAVRHVSISYDETYVWIVEAPRDNNATIYLSLSNDNALDPGVNPVP